MARTNKASSVIGKSLSTRSAICCRLGQPSWTDDLTFETSKVDILWVGQEEEWRGGSLLLFDAALGMADAADQLKLLRRIRPIGLRNPDPCRFSKANRVAELQNTNQKCRPGCSLQRDAIQYTYHFPAIIRNPVTRPCSLIRFPPTIWLYN
jgi:hypothetical protein